MAADAPTPGEVDLRQRAQPRCYLCGAAGSPLYRDLADRAFGVPGRWDLRRCKATDCSLIWLDPVPIDADIALAYRRYFTHRDADAPAQCPTHGGSVLRLLRALLGLRREYGRFDGLMLDNVAPGRLLEIGFGDATRLCRFAARGWRVEGQELDPIAIAQARRLGLSVHAGALAAMDRPAGTFDAIIASHVIEHVHDPIGLLVVCQRLLKPGGRLVLLTPSAAGFGLRYFGASWVGVDPPRHLYLFSARNLAQIAEQAGLMDVRVTSSSACAAPWFTGSLQIALTGRYRVGYRLSFQHRLKAAALLARAVVLQRRGLIEGDELLLQARR